MSSNSNQYNYIHNTSFDNNNPQDSQYMKNDSINYPNDINLQRNAKWFNINDMKNQNNGILNNPTDRYQNKFNQLFNKDNNINYDNKKTNFKSITVKKNNNNLNSNKNASQLNYNNNNDITKQILKNYQENNTHEYLINKSHKPNLLGSCLCSISHYSPVIDRNESNKIKNIVQIYYTTFGRNEDEEQNEKKSLSSLISSQIKNELGGEWFVFVSKKHDELYFNISSVNESDILVIDIGQSIFRIAKTK